MQPQSWGNTFYTSAFLFLLYIVYYTVSIYILSDVQDFCSIRGIISLLFLSPLVFQHEGSAVLLQPLKEQRLWISCFGSQNQLAWALDLSSQGEVQIRNMHQGQTQSLITWTIQRQAWPVVILLLFGKRGRKATHTSRQQIIHQIAQQRFHSLHNDRWRPNHYHRWSTWFLEGSGHIRWVLPKRLSDTYEAHRRKVS